MFLDVFKSEFSGAAGITVGVFLGFLAVGVIFGVKIVPLRVPREIGTGGGIEPAAYVRCSRTANA